MSNDVPIERRNWVEAQPLLDTGDGGELEVVRCYPCQPVEDAQGLEYIVGKPKVNKHDAEGVCKESEPGDVEYLSKWAKDGVILLCSSVNRLKSTKYENFDKRAAHTIV